VGFVTTTSLGGRPVALAAGSDRTVRLVDLATGAHLGDVGGQDCVCGLAVGEVAGRPLVAVSHLFSPPQLWDLIDRAPIAMPGTDGLAIREIVGALLDNEGEPLAVTRRGPEVSVRHLHDPTSVCRLDAGNAEAVTALAAQDGVVAVARRDRAVRLFDLRSGNVLGTVELPYPATALAWLPDGDLVIACRRDLLRVGR
jgi:hypothetical protein